MRHVLGKVVSAARISQLIHHRPRGPRWVRDTDQVLDWCGPPMAEHFYNETISPLLEARAEMDEGRPKRLYAFKDGRSPDGLIRYRWATGVDGEAEWERKHPQSRLVRALAAAYESLGLWRRDVRNRIICHLHHDQGLAKEELARRFTLSLRQVSRVLASPPPALTTPHERPARR